MLGAGGEHALRKPITEDPEVWILPDRITRWVSGYDFGREM